MAVGLWLRGGRASPLQLAPSIYLTGLVRDGREEASDLQCPTAAAAGTSRARMPDPSHSCDKSFQARRCTGGISETRAGRGGQ